MTDEKMKTGRVLLIILDSVGIGAMPDSPEYGDEGVATLPHIASSLNGINLPNLASIGLGRIEHIEGVSPEACKIGAYGKMNELSIGKDTITGHWEIAGIILEEPFKTFPNGFPKKLIDSFEKAIGRKTLANKPASGTEIIAELGEEHVKTGCPIVYTSADSVFQIAAHENVIPVDKLYHFCTIARQLCQGENLVARVIARPFLGENSNFYRTERRKDFAVLPPSRTILQDVFAEDIPVISIGKIEDIFVSQGITHSFHTAGNQDGMKTIEKVLIRFQSGFIFANLVDFDMKYGHRRNVSGYGKALQEFDEWLPTVFPLLNENDLLIITADHGCDPTAKGSDHTREYVPLLVWSPALKTCKSLGTRKTFADIAQTLADYFSLTKRSVGTSFLNQII